MSLVKRFDLICFDVDGTLVKHPDGMVIWEVLNIKYGGSPSINKERYEMFHAGRITYDEWVRLDVQGWVEAGATREDILRAVREFRPIDGALETVTELKRRGFRLAVISGTLDIVLDTIFDDHPFDEVYTNKLFFDENGKLSSWQATPFDLYGKPEALKLITEKYDIPLTRSAYVGDGDNDVPLLGTAGYFVAFQPRSAELERGADIVIRNEGLRKLLEIFT